MKKSVNIFLPLILVTASFLAGNWYNERAARRSLSVKSQQILYYQDPMHPAYKSDRPGTAPDCGMDLEPVYADGRSAIRSQEKAALSLPAGAVSIAPEKQQLLGVVVGPLEKASVSHSLRTWGRVAVDENRIFPLLASTDGLIREIYAGSTGRLVQRDQRLASFYNRDLVRSQEAYLSTLDALEKIKQSTPNSEQIPSMMGQVRFNKENLIALGVSRRQIDEITQTREAGQLIDIVAPATALVVTRNAFFGQRFERGAEMFRLVDLSRVWILADLFENEAQHVKPGLRVRIFLPYQQKTFQAKVSSSLPQIDPVTRALKVRLEVNNPGFALRPDMFVDVEFPIHRPAAIVVPVDAVLDSGLKKTVFVDLGNGFFAPRTVETGWRWDGQVEIVKGLESGERVVLSGNFLIDSESRMKTKAISGQR